MNDLKFRKNEMRSEFKRLRLEYAPEKRLLSDAEICRRILSLASYRYAGAVLLYAPVRGEVNVMPVAEKALCDGKKVCFPKCGIKPFMDFRQIDSTNELIPGSFGVPEPGDERTVFDPEDKGLGTICIIPALSFDKQGYRLGYGGGYYDRYLSGYRGTKIGVVYGDMLSDKLPRGRYDINVDIIVTEKRTINVRSI